MSKDGKDHCRSGKFPGLEVLNRAKIPLCRFKKKKQTVVVSGGQGEVDSDID